MRRPLEDVAVVSVLVIGGKGQLGRHLREELPDSQFWDRSVVDLSNPSELSRRLGGATPSAIVNAAAYTAVDRAESERDVAWAVNAEAPAVLARAAQRLSIPLVHVSTDYVFDGSKADGYVESDPVAPLSVYGRSKLGGELAVTTLCERHWILRTSWVFSEHGNNFPKTMLRLGREREELRVVADQRGRPTYAGDLARCIVGLLHEADTDGALPWGLHHVGGGAVVSWKEFADEIFARASSAGVIPRVPQVVAITTDQYPTPAVRPRNSLLLTRAIHARQVSDPFDWQRGLDRVIAVQK
jgi:dTDP-4-dehydrorhamnose reductase